MINENPPKHTEIFKAIKQLKKKAADPDGIPPEVFMARPNTLETLLEPLIKTTWELEHFPDEWKNGYIFKLPKKGDLSNCKNWRGIMLLNTINKLVTIILYQQLIAKLEPLLRKKQAGFRPHRSCTDHINTMRIVVEQSLEYCSPLYMIFVDFERAFDSLKHSLIWQTLTERGVPTKLVNIIKELYNTSTCQFIHRNRKSENIPVRSVVKQGCVLSPLLFNIVLDTAVAKATDTPRGIRWTLADRLDDLEYTDDICLLAHTFNDIRTKLQRLQKETSKISLKINISKTKEMCIHTPNNQPLLLNDQQIEQVTEFPYLCSIISKDNGGTDKDVAVRIKKACGVFGMLNTVWRSTTYSNNTKLRIFNTNVKSVLIYGCETWRLTKTIIHQLQVLVNRCIRRILNVFWPVQISNQEMRTRAKQKPIELEIQQRKSGWLGHTLRRPPGDIAKAALELCPQGTRSRGRPGTTWRRTILEEIWNEVKGLARKRVIWRKFVRALWSLEE